MLNRVVMARGSSSRNEKSEKPQQKEESSEEPSNSNQQTSNKTRFGWNDLYMRSHNDSETKRKTTKTKFGL